MNGKPVIEAMSAWTLVSILAIFLSSLLVFLYLARRWTVHVGHATLRDWSKRRSFRIRTRGANVPAPLDAIPGHDARSVVTISDSLHTIARIETTRTDAHGTAGHTWHVLVTPASGAGRSALRPVTTPKGESLVDLVGLEPYPAVAPGNRFVVHAFEPSAARALAEGAARGLLPPDVGLIFLDDKLILDFSARPFDTIEFERMLAVAAQIKQFRGAATG
jgi:hypothetical protein